MALPTSGAGYQIGDGNLDEKQFDNIPAPTTATDTATLTVAQLLNGIILATPTAAANYTLPTVATLEASLANATKTGNYFEFTIINLASNSSYDITIVTNTGWTVTGGGVVVVQELSSARFGARKTGTATWQLYRLS
jgi:hypothetical protein